MIVHETCMLAQYEGLRNYFINKFPECQIQVMYEAGFRGFELHDQLVADGWECVVTPPHTLTEEKCQRKKNDRTDCRRLAKNLENGDYRKCFVPDKGLREDRQIPRTYGQVQTDVKRVCNRIRVSWSRQRLTCGVVERSYVCPGKAAPWGDRAELCPWVSTVH